MIVTVEKLNAEGLGVAHIDGKTILVDGVLPQEKVVIERAGRRKGKLISVLEPSPDRREPFCPYYAVCGGCQLQHMAHSAQLSYKQNRVLDLFQEVGHVAPASIAAPLVADTAGYRHKARLGVKWVKSKDQLFIGFREKHHHGVADMERCSVLHSSIGQRIGELKQILSPLDCAKTIPQIEVAVGGSRAALIIRHLEPLSASDQARFCQLAQDWAIEVYLQPKGLDSIHKLWPQDGKDELSYCLPGENIMIEFHPSGFTQINESLNRNMVSQAIQWLAPEPDEQIMDLFCGVGNFTLPLARHCRQIIGIEGDTKAVDQAKKNAAKNGIVNVEFYVHDLYQESPKPYLSSLHCQKILMDPPRSGALPILSSLPHASLKKIVYVSCCPETLARDVGILVNDFGWKFEKYGLLDMFPHTYHIESMVVLGKL